MINNNLIDAIKNYKVKLINVINNEDSEINKRVKKIYVINLETDVKKRNYIICLLKKYKLNFTLVIVNKVPKSISDELLKNSLISVSELGCCLSHLWCLYNTLVNKYSNAIIFEDDIILHKDFESKFLSIYDINPSVDFLLLGAHDFHFSSMNHKNVKNNLYRPAESCVQLYGAHANYYSYRGAKQMFYIRTTQLSFFDKEYMLMFNYLKNAYVCYPNLVVSNITDSRLNHERSLMSELERDYYKKCFIGFNFNDYNFLYVNLLNASTKIKITDTYISYTENYLYNYFHDFDKIEIVKKRLVHNFFTLEDIGTILSLV